MSDTITIKQNDEDRELFMSFGLLNELTRIIGTPDRVPQVALDPNLRDEFLTALFAKRKKSGKIEEAADIEDLDVSYEDVELVLRWAQEHVMSFFVRSFRQIKAVTDKHEAEVMNLTSSLVGSKSSPSKKE